MLKVILIGCNGRMGQVISNLAATMDNLEIVAGCDINTNTPFGYPVYTDTEINNCTITADVIIDFSHPLAFDSVTEYAIKNMLPLVMATTGLSGKQIEKLNYISKTIAVFRSANMSMGVNLVMELAKIAAAFTENLFDIEIIEKHHNKKLDAPSGTALSIADSINEALKNPKTPVYDRSSYRKERDNNEIGIHAIRGGTIVGEHTVIFAGSNEIIEIKHEATSRDIFGSGALKAATFLYNKPAGLYSMSNIINI